MNYLQFVEKDNERVQIGWILEVPNALSRDEVLKAIRNGYRPKGKWRTSRVHGGIVKCDFCGFDWGSNEGRKFNYCPNCGADMRGNDDGI